MTLEAGKRLRHYRLIEKIGEGGMGVVWKAEDTQLGREVALKFLTETFAADAERLARFEREAKLLASLNHANIATIHGLAEADGQRFLVLEFVPGEDLADRLKSGPLPVAEVVTLCRQLTEALDAAHERGILHRDLKPANLKVTSEGGVKVLDFGLAKAWEAETVSGDLSQSPTLTHQMTRAGVILGTAAYMSPEQARGRTTDKRSDIWSFGCILFELLSGRKAFSGETVSDNIAAILKMDPEWSLLPATTPPRLRELMARCLEKDRRRRLRDIGDARIELEKVEAGDTGTAPEAAEGGPRRLLVPVALLAVGIVLGLLIRAWIGPAAPPASEPSGPTRLSVTVPADQVIRGFKLSRDGEVLLYAAQSTSATVDARPRLYSRRLDTFEIREVPDSEGVEWASFSPDDRSIAYFTQNRDGEGGSIKKVSLEGGPVVELLELRTSPGEPSASWATEDELFISLNRGRTLAKLSADGGEPEEILTLEEDGLWGLSAMPDGRTLLMGLIELGGELSFRVEALDLESKERKVVLADGLGGPLRPGRFLVWRDYTTFVAPFDEERLEFTGPETPLFANRRYSLSETGTLAYMPRYSSTDTVVSVDREGAVEELAEVENARVYAVRVSPDGEEVALITQDNQRVRRRIWNLTLKRNRLVELFSGENWKAGIDWSPAGDALTFSMVTPDGRVEVQRRGTRPGDGWEPVLGDDPPREGSWVGDQSAAGSVILVMRDEDSTWDMWLLPSDEGAEPRPILEAPTHLLTPAISPNGRWLAFSSAESGAPEIYVMSLSDPPGDGEPRLVSESGGLDPVWARDGSELFFEDGAGLLMSARVEGGSNAALPGFGRPKKVLDLRALELIYDEPKSYDVLPDGGGFVFTRRQEAQGVSPQVYVVLGWLDELERKHPLDE
jgi:Tol biopolymer transport system component